MEEGNYRGRIKKIGKMERNSNGGSPKIIKTRSHMYVGCCPGKNF